MPSLPSPISLKSHPQFLTCCQPRNKVTKLGWMDHSGAVRREPGPRCHLTGLPLHQMHRHRSRRQRHCCQTHSQQAAPHPAERGSRPRSSNLPCSLCSQPTSSQRSHTRAHTPVPSSLSQRLCKADATTSHSQSAILSKIFLSML